MHMGGSIGRLVLVVLLVLPATARAAHPLITDDAGTQGKGNYQLEVNGQDDTDKETVAGVSVKSTGGQALTILSYGVIDTSDLVLTVPYVWGKVTEDGVTTYDEKGFSDVSFEIKWRFFEKNGLSIAVKPGIIFPTGNDEKGLGTGKTGYHVFLIGSKVAAPWAFHANLGYMRNVTKFDVEQENLWHASLAATYEAVPGVKIVGNIGQEKNRSKSDYSDDSDPAFLIAGLIYSPNEDVDLDVGVKRGLTSSEADWSLMAGTTFRF